MPMTERHDWSDLKELYVVQGLGRRAIAKIKNCYPNTVLAALRRYSIEPRSRSESQKRGPRHHSFKHGQVPGGYYRCTHQGKRIRLHRLIAEGILGRPLTALEIVHHCEEPDNNHPSNLWVFPSQSAHITYHNNGTIHPDTIFLKDCISPECRGDP
jgi:hypothetical protein